jgi:hypothetical protein
MEAIAVILYENLNRRSFLSFKNYQYYGCVTTHCLLLCLLYLWNTKRVKCTLVQALRLRTGLTVHSGSRAIALPFLDHGIRRLCGVSVTPRQLFTPRKDPVPIVQEAGWAPGPVWTGAENLALTGIRSPYLPARSQLLYRLSYPAHLWNISLDKSARVSNIFIKNNLRCVTPCIPVNI